MNELNVSKVLNYFSEYPSRYTHGFQRIMEKLDVTIDEIKEAKKRFNTNGESVKMTNQAIDFDNFQIERVWTNNKGKISYQLRPINNTEDFLTFSDEMSVEKNLMLWNLTPIINLPNSISNKVLLVYTSDKHIGARVDSTAMIPNAYSAEEYLRRMESLAVEVIKLDTLHHFDKIIVLDLGDAIDGQDGFTGSKSHRLPQNMTNREVFDLYISSHLSFFKSLSIHTGADLEYRTIGSSNHGGDLEWICFKSLASILGTHNIPCYVGNKFIEHFYIGDHAFLISHGKDYSNMKFPMPRYLNEKTESYILRYIKEQDIQSKFIHFIKGDLHISTSEMSSFFRYKNCLSLFGSSEWTSTNFMNHLPGVSMEILDLSVAGQLNLSEVNVYFNHR
jgi:hypothetical protein